MTFTERLEKIIKEKGITKNKMLKDLNFGTGTFATWKKRGTIPNGDMLSKIADYFNVTTDYLLGIELTSKEVEKTDKMKAILAYAKELGLPVTGNEVFTENIMVVDGVEKKFLMAARDKNVSLESMLIVMDAVEKEKNKGKEKILPAEKD